MDLQKSYEALKTKMSACGEDTSPSELMEIIIAWKKFKAQYIEASTKNTKIPPPKAFFGKLYSTSFWKAFDKQRRRIYRKSEAYKKKARKYQKDRYQEREKARRNRPDVKEARNKHRRELYAAKKDQAKKDSSPSRSDNTMAEGHGV